MKKLMLAVILSLILVSGITGCEKKIPVFQLSNLVVGPSQIVGGDTASFSVTVTNTGNAEGVTTVSFTQDSTAVGSQSVTLLPAASQDVTITAIQDQPGLHTVAVNAANQPFTPNKKTTTPIVSDLSQDFTVLKPAEFTLSTMQISEDVVEPGDDITVSAEVSNIGEVPGEYKVTLKMDGEDVDTKTLTVNGGDKQTVSFVVSSKDPGNHDLAAGDLAQSFKVLKPAEFQTSNLKLSPATVTAGWSSTITIDVTNVGEIKGDYSLNLKINDQSIESKQVSLEGGASDTVSFTVLEDSGGTYNVAVNDLKDVLTVQEGVAPVLHAGDQWVYRLTYDGSIYTCTETVTGTEILNGKDCYVVKLVFDPKFMGIYSTRTEWWDKSTLDTIMYQISIESSGVSVNQTMTAKISYIGNSWPLTIGNQFTKTSDDNYVTESIEGKSTQSYHSVYIYKIEKFETIKVNAGEFRCFKYTESTGGKVVAEAWYSDKAKAGIKYASTDGTFLQELLSYSVKGD